MTAPVDQIRQDFDRIAQLTERHGGESDTYHQYLSQQLPPRFESALEIGCGTGEFTRLLASRAKRVLALDLSPQMIRVAESQSENYPNIQYSHDDFMRRPLPEERYDCIVSIATLHHLPMSDAVRKMKNALKPGGVLIIHDLVAPDGLVDLMASAMAFPASVARRFWRTGRLLPPREVRRAWVAHGKGEAYLTPKEIREMCRRYLPGARIRHHLFWRYTVVWSAPEKVLSAPRESP